MQIWVLVFSWGTQTTTTGMRSAQLRSLLPQLLHFMLPTPKNEKFSLISTHPAALVKIREEYVNKCCMLLGNSVKNRICPENWRLICYLFQCTVGFQFMYGYIYKIRKKIVNSSNNLCRYYIHIDTQIKMKTYISLVISKINVKNKIVIYTLGIQLTV